jgi:hypothetical protein
MALRQGRDAQHSAARRVRRRHAAPARVLFIAAFLGCAGSETIPLWRAPIEASAPDANVAAALGDSYGGPRHGFDQAAIREPPEPTNLRPCCLFGDDFKIVYGGVPIPGYVLHNMRGPEEVGPHKYNVGLLESVSSEEPGGLTRENNGLVYTCRSGFIDVAHLRDYADMTVYLAAKIERQMDTGGVIELADQGGKRRILLQPIGAERITDVGRRRLTVALAQWLVFQISTWHELASWYGYAPVPYWPEEMSAFSPEDLYSSLLGIKLAGGIILFHDTSDDIEYEHAMNAWIKMALARIQTTTKESATAAINAVDGRWWDSSKRLPDSQLLLRRNFDAGPWLEPWLVPMAFSPEPGPSVGCDDAGPPLRLRSPSRFQGVRFEHDATLEIDVGYRVADNAFPFPRRGTRRITQADFPSIIERTRRQAVVAFGPGYDQPSR